jgi:hypothetical protein
MLSVGFNAAEMGSGNNEELTKIKHYMRREQQLCVSASCNLKHFLVVCNTTEGMSQKVALSH